MEEHKREKRPAPKAVKRTGIMCSGCDNEITGRVYRGRVCRDCRKWQFSYAELIGPIYAGAD